MLPTRLGAGSSGESKMAEREAYFAKRDRVELERILQDIESGKITLRHGQDDYVAGLRRRIAKIEGKLGYKASD